MRRILLVLAVGAVMAAMVALSALPAMAQEYYPGYPEANQCFAAGLDPDLCMQIMDQEHQTNMEILSMPWS